jgi:hypothetical protein
MIALRTERWQARFHATYSRFFRACYSTELTATLDGPYRFKLHGSTDLGWFAGGRYEYEGVASGSELICGYTSRFDRGEFRLKRPFERTGPGFGVQDPRTSERPS